jgi:hypothetical protein
VRAVLVCANRIKPDTPTVSNTSDRLIGLSFAVSSLGAMIGLPLMAWAWRSEWILGWVLD